MDVLRILMRAFVVLALALCVTPAPAGSCDTADPCSSPGNLGLQIACDPTLTVTTSTCGSLAAFESSLLRVAVRCFDSGEPEQARYWDSHGFDHPGSQNLNALVGGCSNFIAAAQWIRNGTREGQAVRDEVQAQCAYDYTGPGDEGEVPDCVPAEPGEAADLSGQFFLYSAVLPRADEQGTVSCYSDEQEVAADLSRVEVRNGSLNRAYQGVLSGRYLCTQSTSYASFAYCDDPDSTIRDRGQFGNVFGFNVAPQAFFYESVNPSGGFNHCCDNEVSNEIPGLNCTTDPHLCSPLDIQCSSAAVFSVCRDGAVTCSESGAEFHPLDRVAWFGPRLDIEPGDSGESPSDFPEACFHHSFAALTAGEDEATTDHTFGPAPLPSPEDDDCGSPAGDFRDADFDRVYDVCDTVLGNIAPADGAQTLVVRNNVRNDAFPFAFTPASDEVRFGAVLGTVVEGQSSQTELTVEIPPLTAGGGVEITVTQTGEPSLEGSAGQLFFPRWFGYVSDGTADAIVTIDLIAERTSDVNAAPTNSHINLNCDPGDGILTVNAPWDLALRSVGSADREIYALSDVTTTSGTGYRLFGIDVQTHRLVNSGGIVLAGSGRALHIADDADDVTHAYVARKVSLTETTTTSTLTVVDLEANPPAVTDGQAQGVVIRGLPMGVRTSHFAEASPNAVTYAYVTSVECVQDFGGPELPCQLGQCPEAAQEKVWLTAVDTTDKDDMTVAWEHNLVTRNVESCHSEVLVGRYENVGLEFSLDRSMLFVVNPDLDEVRIVDVPANTVRSQPIYVGDYPVDVTVVALGGDPDKEMAYVVNKLDQDITQIEVWNNFNTLDDIASGPPVDPTRFFVAIEALSDGTRLFTATRGNGSVGVVNIDPADPEAPLWKDDIHTGFYDGQSTPKRLVLLHLSSAE